MDVKNHESNSVLAGRSLLLSSQFSRGRFDPFPPFLRPATQAASNVACRAKLGTRFRAISQKIMNYSSYLLSKDNCSIGKQIFPMSQDLHHAGKNGYYSNIISMSEYCNFSCFALTYLTSAKIKPNVFLIQQNYILYDTMQNSTKLKFFNTFKNAYTPSSYLDLTSKLSENKELVKFRIGNHKLRTETCKYL